jgi:hypothetical protein
MMSLGVIGRTSRAIYSQTQNRPVYLIRSVYRSEQGEFVSHENLDNYIGAYGERFPFADENVRMLHSYAGYVIDSIGERQRVDILSLGIGYQTVATRIVTELGERLGSYVILEGGRCRHCQDSRRSGRSSASPTYGEPISRIRFDRTIRCHRDGIRARALSTIPH